MCGFWGWGTVKILYNLLENVSFSYPIDDSEYVPSRSLGTGDAAKVGQRGAQRRRAVHNSEEDGEDSASVKISVPED
jgi:hypothetical protein